MHINSTCIYIFVSVYNNNDDVINQWDVHKLRNMHCETALKSPLSLHEKAFSNTEMANEAISLPWGLIIIKPANVEIHARNCK